MDKWEVAVIEVMEFININIRQTLAFNKWGLGYLYKWELWKFRLRRNNIESFS